MGYALLLTSVFKYFGMDLTSAKFQVIRHTRLETYPTLPPRPFFMVKFSEKKEVDDKDNLNSQLTNMSSIHLKIWEILWLLYTPQWLLYNPQ